MAKPARFFTWPKEKKASLESFFQKLSPKQTKKIKAVIQQYALKAQIVFDKSHIVGNLNTAVDKVRRSEWRNANKENKQFIKGQLFNLLCNAHRLKDHQCDDLAQLFEANEALFQGDLLKDEFAILWIYVRPKWASRFLDNWIEWAKKRG